MAALYDKMLELQNSLFDTGTLDAVYLAPQPEIPMGSRVAYFTFSEITTDTLTEFVYEIFVKVLWLDVADFEGFANFVDPTNDDKNIWTAIRNVEGAIFPTTAQFNTDILDLKDEMGSLAAQGYMMDIEFDVRL